MIIESHEAQTLLNSVRTLWVVHSNWNWVLNFFRQLNFRKGKLSRFLWKHTSVHSVIQSRVGEWLWDLSGNWIGQLTSFYFHPARVYSTNCSAPKSFFWRRLVWHAAGMDNIYPFFLKVTNSFILLIPWQAEHRRTEKHSLISSKHDMYILSFRISKWDAVFQDLMCLPSFGRIDFWCMQTVSLYPT